MSKRRKRNSNRRHCATSVVVAQEEDVLTLMTECVRCLMNHQTNINKTIESVARLHSKLSKRDPPMIHDND